jgi:hypothetical protein
MSSLSNAPPGGHFLTAALRYARLGFRVHPVHSIDAGTCTCGEADCSSPGKHPLTPHGCLDATDDETVIQGWAEQAPTANVAIATGRASGVWVLDVDGAEGLEGLAELERTNGALSPTARARTGGGGEHLFFATSDGEVRCATGLGGLRIDVRGEHGYVVVPPSCHVSGEDYEWAVSPEECPPIRAPGWLQEFVRSGRIGSTIVPGSNTGTVITMLADDLGEADGVPEGNRRSELCRLVGHHITRGNPADDVEAAALVWADRCQPPLPAAEVRGVVRDLNARSNARTTAPAVLSNGQDNIETMPLPDPHRLPGLHGPALHGLVGDFVRQVAPETEAAPAALLIQFLVAFGTAIGRSAHTIVEEDKHYANLFAVLIGPSAVGRKGSSAGRVLRAYNALEDEDWSRHRVTSGLSSGEGLIWAVRDPITKTEPIKEGQQITGYREVVTDAGVDDKRLLVLEPEFGKVLKVASRDTNTLSPTIRMAWDSGSLRTMTRNTAAVATDAHISIVGHSTPDELHRYLTTTELANGFANRFLWVMVRRVQLLPEGGRRVDLSELVQQLQVTIRFARQTGLVTRDPDASELWREAYADLSSGRPGLYGQVTSRAEAQVLRLSLIYALLDRSATIRREHVEAALGFWGYCQQSARLIFGDGLGDVCAERVRKAIEARPGITRTGLYEATSKHTSRQQLLAALGTLEAVGLARRETEATGGRPRERWFPVRRPCEESEESAPGEEVISLSSLSSPPSGDNPESDSRQSVEPADAADEADGGEEVEI